MLIKAELKSRLCMLLSLDDDDLNDDQTISELGLDSLAGTELRNCYLRN